MILVSLITTLAKIKVGSSGSSPTAEAIAWQQRACIIRMYKLSDVYHSDRDRATHIDGRVTTVESKSTRAGACTRFASAAMLVGGGIGTVEVHILVAHEATVSVLWQ